MDRNDAFNMNAMRMLSGPDVLQRLYSIRNAPTLAQVDPRVMMLLANLTAQQRQPDVMLAPRPTAASQPQANPYSFAADPRVNFQFLTDKPHPNAPRMVGASAGIPDVMGGNLQLRGEYKPNANLRTRGGQDMMDYLLRAAYSTQFQRFTGNMQTTIYTAEEEQTLMARLWSPTHHASDVIDQTPLPSNMQHIDVSQGTS